VTGIDYCRFMGVIYIQLAAVLKTLTLGQVARSRNVINICFPAAIHLAVARRCSRLNAICAYGYRSIYSQKPRSMVIEYSIVAVILDK
jgi:hypothetical protein